MNKVMMIGNLVRDPETRATQSGVTVCNFTLAVNRRFKNAQTGERETDFFRVVAWRQLGELCAKFLQKGRKVLVVGELQTREYTGSDGVQKRSYEISADEVEFLTPNSAVEGTQATAQAAPPAKPFDPTAGFTQVEDDDLPF